MSAECSLEMETGDEAQDVGVNEPHAEHFDSLRESDPTNTGHHFTFGSPVGVSKSEGDLVRNRLGLTEEQSEDDAGPEEPGTKASPSESGDTHTAEGRIEKDEAGTEGDITQIDDEHDEEGRAGIADGAQGIGAGIENSEDGAGPGEDGKVVEGIRSGCV